MSFLRSTIVMKPVGVLGAEVPGAEPPVDDGLGGGVGVVEVAGEDVVPADDDLAELAGRQQLDPVVDRLRRATSTSTPQIGCPTVPARVPNCGWLIVAVGEVSDRP